MQLLALALNLREKQNNMEKYLSKQQIQGLINEAPTSIPTEEIIQGLVNRGYQLEGLEQPKVEEPKKESLMEKVAGFTGGKEIAQGLGQAMANKEIQAEQERIQKADVELQGKLVEQIKSFKEQGKDTTRLEGALQDLINKTVKEGQGREELLNQEGLTNKQVLGSALQLGTTIAGAGALPSAGKSVIGANTIGQGIIQGAKTGAITGGAFGASSGVSEALKEDKTGAEIAKEGLGGALTGGLLGGALGAVTGGVSGAIKSKQARDVIKKKTFVEDLVSPKMTTAVKEQALKEGRVTEQGLLSASKIKPSKRDLQLAEAVKDVINPKKSIEGNIDLISKKLDDINSGVKAYVSSKKTPFNTNQVLSQLNKGKDELKLVFAGDKQAEKTYNAVVKEFMKHIKSKDTAGLFEARQKFDSIPAIKKLLDSQGLGENVKKEIVLTVRGKANEYVASLLPKGNQFRDTLLRESKMIEAIQNIVEKGASAIGKNKIQILAEKYPIIKPILGGVAGGLGLGAVGVGSSILGSSD